MINCKYELIRIGLFIIGMLCISNSQAQTSGYIKFEKITRDSNYIYHIILDSSSDTSILKTDTDLYLSDNNPLVKKDKIDQEPIENNNFNWEIILAGIISFAFAISLFFNSKLLKLYKVEKKLKAKIKSQSDVIDETNAQNVSLKSEYNKLRKEVTLKNENTTKTLVEKKQASTITEIENVRKVQSPTFTTYYAMPPNNNNTFEQSSMDQNINIGHFRYQIEVNEQTGQGTYKIISDTKAHQPLVFSSDQTLKPFCDFENNLISFKIKIVNVKAGKVKKVNNGWEITEKAKIRFE